VAAQELRGEAVLTFAFDVANEIATDRVRTVLSQTPTRLAFRADRTDPKSLPPYRPLEVEPGTGVRFGGRSVRTLVRVYDVGVVTVTLRIPFEAPVLTDLRAVRAPVFDDGRPAGAVAAEVCAEACRDLAPATTRPGPAGEPEAYTAFCLTELGGARDASVWLAERTREVAGLLAGTDPDRLSDAQVEDVVRLRRSFERTDLVVIDWDAALVVDLDGYAEDVLFVLELANLQLEEFRWMDRYLDGHLDQLYTRLGRGRAAGVGRTLQSLRRLRIDLTRLADEVTHITKFVGDWHLARVYLLARERFQLDQWRASVDQRLSQLDRLYTLTREEWYERRMLWLEVVIVLFFAADLLILLLLKR
jgi:hypothetical protein